ncbi:metal-sensitive transcriptional regulator [Micromonospora chalcea]|uniref:metal-sensitive transcriptional regulator n=1 Tax=Micromonospora chalcea TaxID=1874 RepID=UPI0021A84932|nr:metal-sensitive transcriptional regulator [Micromonospora chalcea]
MSGTGARHRDRRRPTVGEGLVSNRLRRAAGQLGGVLAMYEAGRHPAEILDQIAAVRGALDAVALAILDEHATTCDRQALDEETRRAVTDLTTTVRRYVHAR